MAHRGLKLKKIYLCNMSKSMGHNIKWAQSRIGSVTRGLRLLLIAVLLVAMSCSSTNSERQRIEHAEKLLTTEPAEALSIISSVDSRRLNTRLMARYALVYSEACYYNRILVSSDSLTSIAVEYYSTKRRPHEQARAYYQHGLVLQLQDRMPEAILAFTSAEEALESAPDRHLEGVLYRAMGDVYRARYCYTNSYDAYTKAYECFDDLNLPYHRYYTKYNMGQVALKMHNYEEAEALLIEARDYAIESDDPDFLCAVLHELCEMYLHQQDYVRCSETVALFDEYDCALWFVSRYYALKAIVSSEAGNNDEALMLVNMAEKVVNRDDAIIEEAKAIIYRNIGDMASAMYWLKVVNRRMDNKLIDAAEQPVLNYQIDLLESTLEKEEREIEILWQRNIAIYIVIGVVIFVTLLMARNHRRRLQRDIVHYMETINELQLTRNNNNEPLTEAIDHLYNDRLKDLNHLCETYYDHSDTPRQASRVFEQVRQTIEAIKSDEGRLAELEHLVNSCRNDLMTKLREQCPKLNERELKVVLYSYAGFSSRAICIFVDSNPIALSKIKYRIKTKIKECGGEDAEMLISAINDR